MAQTLESPETATPISPGSTGWLDRFAQVMGRLVPDAITACIIFMLLVRRPRRPLRTVTP